MPGAGAGARAGDGKDMFSALRRLLVSPGKRGQQQKNRINKDTGTNYHHCHTGRKQGAVREGETMGASFRSGDSTAEP